MDKSLGTFFSIHTRLTPPPTLTNNIERVYPQFFFRVLKFYRVGEGEL